jgi:nucleotide-binding universal stress UspA family protein
MRYLVGLSADRGGREALGLGRMLTRTGDVGLVVCIVLPEVWGHPSPARVDVEYAQFLAAHAEEAIQRARELLGDDVTAEFVARAAPSATEGLIAVAAETGAALIVLGSARHGGVGRLMVGGVTDEMLHASPVPVVLSPRGYRSFSEERLRRVTCAFAGSARSQTAFEAAAQLSRRHAVPLRLTSLLVRDRQMYPSSAGLDAERLVEEQWRRQATEAQERALARLGPGLEVEAGVFSAADWEDALDALPWEDGELLVVGSSRLGPVARVFLGANSTKIVRSSPVPVVVVPRGADVHLEDTAEMPAARI